MRVLGIDTILHDVCAAVVENGRFVLSNVVEHTVMDSSQLYELPDLHLNQIGTAIKKALKKAECKPECISLIAVNNFGSFYSNVLIGVVAAETLAKVFNKPIIAVHHQEAHYFSNWLERNPKDFKFPILVLSSSGGHSSIGKILNDKFKYKELYKIEGMEEKKKNTPFFRGIGAIYGYAAFALKIAGPIGGGSLVSKYARGGNKTRFDFCGRMKNFNITKLDFSEMEKFITEEIGKELKEHGGLSKKFISDMAAGFEYSMGQLMVGGLIKLAKKERVKEIHLVGGVSANDVLRKIIGKNCLAAGIEFKYPKKKLYCTDNAAMIASLGYYKYKVLPLAEKQKLFKNRMVIDSNLRLEKIAFNQRKNV